MAEACASLKLKRSIMACLAKSGFLAARMMWMISSMLSCAMSRPNTICSLFSALAKSKRVRPHDHVVAVLDEMLHQIQQIEHHRTTVHQRDVVHRERGLQRRILIQRIEHHARHGIVFQDDDDTHAVPVGLVVDIGNALDLLFVDKVGDLLDHLRLVDHIGNFGDDDALAAAGRMLDLRAGTHDHTAPACQQRFPNPFVAVNNSSGREIGALDVLEQFLTCYLRIVHESTAGIDHLAQDCAAPYWSPYRRRYRSRRSPATRGSSSEAP